MRFVIAKSDTDRFQMMCDRLDAEGIAYSAIDLHGVDWMDVDFAATEAVYYYPKFFGSDSTSSSTYTAVNNLRFLAERFPHLRIYPDPRLLRYYNDKYEQFMFLRDRGYPIPETIPLHAFEEIPKIGEQLGFPLVVKNRHGAGGTAVFLANNKRQLATLLSYARGHFSLLTPLTIRGTKRVLMDAGRILFRPRSFERPELSLPLLAQKRINVDRDLRIVVVNGKTWEAHWRVCEKGWKANIDGGGAGIWSQVPEDVLESSEQLAADLETQWLAVDVLYDDGQFHITEFSPVWHHYRINEKANFSYREDYNIDTPVDEGHDFEGMIIRTLFFPQGMPQPD